MRRMNPDNLMDSAKDTGVAALIALPAAALVGLGAYGASKIDYPVAAGDMFSPMTKRAGLVALGSLVLGTVMQLSKSTEKVGQAIAVLGVGIPAALMVQDKVTGAMAPTAPVAQPLVAAPSAGFYSASGGMPGFGQSSYVPLALPVGYQPSGTPNFTPAAFVPVVR